MPRAGWLAVGATVAALLDPAAISAGSPALARPMPALVVAALALLVAVVLAVVRRVRHRASPRLAPPLAVVAGALAVAVRLSVAAQPVGPVALPEGSGPWHGRVESVGQARAGQQAATIRLEEAELRISATLPSYPPVHAGSLIVASGRLRPPPEGDYGAYLRRTGIAGTLASRTLDVAPDGPMDAAAELEAARRAAGELLETAFPAPIGGLAAGILIGLRDRVDRDLAAAFTTAGVSHVVAISGWNIAIVLALVGALVRRASRRRRAIAILGAVLAYTAFAGASPSVLRAAAMAAVVLLARESGRAGRAASALGMATALLLIADPGLARDAGMQLSVLATAGLLVWATPIRSRLDRVAPGRLPDWLAESLALSTAAQLATLPVILSTFGRLSLVSPVANLAVAPIVPVAMAGGALGLLAGAIAALGGPIPLVAIVALPGWLSLGAMIAVVRASASVPFASVDLTPPFDTAAALVAVAVSIALLPGVRTRLRSAVDLRRGGATKRSAPVPAIGGGPTHDASPHAATTASRAVRLVAVALAAAIALTVLAASSRPDGRVRITVLDVGQGDAILVEGDRGGRLLVDGGPDGATLLRALDERIAPWDRRIDVLVLTHPHDDHVGGLAALLGRYRVGNAFENGMRGPGPAYR
ncbi:MAG TPA: ComEC/Rec2 family competence protein, partial [Candidatus Dormibacteraeota bacterium]|nr:ComEC/Rec2 family competence protein [Candidatus Dormibacteraeota bacterium]